MKIVIFDSVQHLNKTTVSNLTPVWRFSHYCQLYNIPIYLQFSSLFPPYDISKCGLDVSGHKRITFQGCRFHQLVSFSSNDTAETKLEILAFLYCEEFVKTFNGLNH